jgi:uncharacterized glyoxalase superfamily protein PhnB
MYEPRATGSESLENFDCADAFRPKWCEGDRVLQDGVRRERGVSSGQRERRSETVRLVMVVSDPDAAFGRAVAAGAKLVRVVNNEYRWRLGRIVDPYRHHWEIGKPLAEGL